MLCFALPCSRTVSDIWRFCQRVSQPSVHTHSVYSVSPFSGGSSDNYEGRPSCRAEDVPRRLILVLRMKTSSARRRSGSNRMSPRNFVSRLVDSDKSFKSVSRVSERMRFWAGTSCRKLVTGPGNWSVLRPWWAKYWSVENKQNVLLVLALLSYSFSTDYIFNQTKTKEEPAHLARVINN